jgi:error-prone DNA polymerase
MTDYAELHCKTNFSFLEGASHADELVQQAATLGYRALAITDRHSLAGVVRAHTAAKELGAKELPTPLQLIIGAEVHPVDGVPLVLWATDRASYGRLCRLLTVGRRRSEKGECQLHFDDIAQHSAGLLAGVLLQHLSPESEASKLHREQELWADRGYLLAEVFRGPDDQFLLSEWQRLSQQTGLPLVAAGDVHYHAAARLPLHDILTCIRHGVPLAAAEGLLFPNAQRYLKPISRVREAFATVPDALRRTLEVADRCRFSLQELKYEYPVELAPPGITPMEYLRQLTWQGAQRRYPAGLSARVETLLNHELQIISELKYEAFFLTVYDLVQFARSQNILCQGRGSAANSAVCYCLGITVVDPQQADVFFERFLSHERKEAPDIDVDFEHERREEVLQYLYRKYGRERAGLAATVITYRARSAMRDVGKALGLSLDRIDTLAKQVEGYGHSDRLAQQLDEVGIASEGHLGQSYQHLVRELVGFPRHLSQHVGGMVMTQGPLCELVPIENAAMPDRTVIQWDKDDLDDLGILKVDCLCLGMLTAIHKAFDLVQRHYGQELSIAALQQGTADIVAEDPRVYEMICQADTIGVFQIESRAQMSMLPRLRPQRFYDLVIEVAIVRPGPIQGNMVHPYLRRRNQEEPIPPFPTPEIESVLGRTLGVPLFQEQAMRLAVVAAGFTAEEANQLRKAMASWRRPGLIEEFHHKLMEGMRRQGLSEEFAERVFEQIRGFGEYGFPESHAASFAVLVYVSCWLKFHYPEVFTAAVLNSQPMGFYAPAQLVRDARNHGVVVHPADVNASQWDCTLEPHEPVTPNEHLLPEKPRCALRLGFRLLKGVAERHARQIVEARGDRPFRSLADLTWRTGLSPAVITQLAEADALTSLTGDRRAALWAALGQESKPHQRPLWKDQDEEDAPLELPQLSLQEQVMADYSTARLSLKAHPISFYRDQLHSRNVLPARALLQARNNQPVTVAGLVIGRQRPGTAQGITFVTLEDETGIVNLIVQRGVWERFRTVARTSSAWLVHGKLERKLQVIHVLVCRIEDLTTTIGQWQVQSRDFH